MSESYLPADKTFAVCTWQVSSDPRKLWNSKTAPSVFWKNRNHPILNIDDKNINKKFSCKNTYNVWGCVAAFGAGLIAAFIAPLGLVALALAAVVVTGLALAIAMHECTGPLQAGEWFFLHSSVKINGLIAITGASMLKCSKGGIITPFLSENAAVRAAQKVACNNRWEAGLNMGASLLADYFSPTILQSVLSATGVAACVQAGATLIGKLGCGYILFSLIFWAERAAIRGMHSQWGSLNDNESYEKLNAIEGNTLFPLPTKADDLLQDSSDLITAAKDPTGKITVEALPALIAASQSGAGLINDSQLNARLQGLDGLTKQQLRNNASARQLLADLNAGKYPGWKDNITRYNARRMTPSMVDEGIKASEQSFKHNLSKLGENSAKGAALIMPFVANIFSEQARAEMAEEKQNDISDIALNANHPVD